MQLEKIRDLPFGGPRDPLQEKDYGYGKPIVLQDGWDVINNYSLEGARDIHFGVNGYKHEGWGGLQFGDGGSAS